MISIIIPCFNEEKIISDFCDELAEQLKKNNETLNKIKGKKYTSYIVLGVGVTILALVFLKLAKR
jgi:glycosyltransferase involved in cell wall biosynthesis